MGQIYASIPQAIQLKNAGFDKVCAHKAISYSDIYTPFGTKVYYQNIEIADLQDTEGFDGVLYLPTLEEIDLPDEWCIKKDENGCFRVETNISCSTWGDMPEIETRVFENELDARVGAFIYLAQ